MITYEKLGEQQENWGIDVKVRFTDSETGYQRVSTFRFDDQAQITAEYTGRMNAKITNIEFDVNPLNDMRLEGLDIRKVVKQFVQYVRAHPNCTLAQLIIALETAYPGLNWKADKLIAYVKEYLEEKRGQSFTFAQLKTYAINHKFYEVD